MNIFILSYDPEEAAIMQCDQHVVKMPLETSQMLCTAYPVEIAPYGRTHFNHPCNLWLRESKANYEWLIIHGLALCEEYKFRYQKVHKSEDIIYWCWAHMDQLHFETQDPTPSPVAMDAVYKKDNPIESYRNFYKQSKSQFASWNNGREAPEWFIL